MNEFDIYKKLLPKDAIVYDIGAHIGTMSKYLIECGAKHVYAFEPSLYNVPELKQNTKEYSNITIFNVGLHNEEKNCLTKFKDCRTDGELDREQNIEYVILENFIKKNKLELPNFIKLDIEGMESIVLTTFDFLFKESRPIIYLEIHAAHKQNTYQNYANNPHWVWPENGGFDFNNLKKFNYNVLLGKNLEFLKKEDYNPSEGDHLVYILIPQN